MRIRILKSMLVEVEKRRLGEVWDRQLNRWDEFRIEEVYQEGKTCNIKTDEGDIFLSVPPDCFEVLA